MEVQSLQEPLFLPARSRLHVSEQGAAALLLRVIPGPAPPRQPAGKDAYTAEGRGEGLVLADSIPATEQEAFIFLWAQL